MGESLVCIYLTGLLGNKIVFLLRLSEFIYVNDSLDLIDIGTKSTNSHFPQGSFLPGYVVTKSVFLKKVWNEETQESVLNQGTALAALPEHSISNTTLECCELLSILIS